MIFSLDVRRARKGDCLLLHFGSHGQPGLALIDGGPAQVYGPHLKPRLLKLREARGLEGPAPLPVDLLMVSHVDDDHIQGILDLTRELKTQQTRRVSVLNFWHNTFDDLIGNTPAALTASVSAQFGTASLEGGLPEDAWVDADEDDEVIRGCLGVLASIEQGHRLRGDVETLGAALNQEFDGKLILAGSQPVPVAEGLTFLVVGPTRAELEDLQKKHDAWLKTRKKESPEESLAAYVDKSVTNLSSIVVLAESGGKTMLLTGDARVDRILEGLEFAGALKQGGSMEVDLLKIPHHGSSNNLDSDFFERLRASHYVFSGNGEHGNPERETMDMLFTARGGEPFTIHLTYPIDEIDAARQADWEKEQAKEKTRQRKGGHKPVREDWSAARQSIAAFFENTTLANGQRIEVVSESKPHVIDLLDPLGY